MDVVISLVSSVLSVGPGHIRLPQTLMFISVILPRPSLEHCFSVNRIHPYGRGHVDFGTSFNVAAP